MIQIPTFQTTSADFLQEIELGGQLVQIRITWNSRNEFFHMTFTDQNENILRGIKMVPDWPLMDWHRGSLEFEGDLIVVKTDEEAGNEITYNNFNNGWDLFYYTIAEVNMWKDDNGF